MSDINALSPSTLESIGRVLLVSSDSVTITQLSGSSRRFALSPEPCSDARSALERLSRAKFEAVVVDSRLGSQAGAVMEGTRNSASNAHAVVFTISDSEDEAAKAFKAGSTFVLRRPLSAASIDLALKAAYGLIVREKRRYFRCPVELPVTLLGTGMPAIRGRTVNVSEGGMSIATAVLLRPGDHVRVEFTLPGDEFQFALEATVCWVKEQRIGLRFTCFVPHQTPNLQEWLSRRLDAVIPQSAWDKISRRPQD